MARARGALPDELRRYARVRLDVVAAAQTEGTYLRVARDELARLIPGDGVLWIQAHDTGGTGCLVLRGVFYGALGDFKPPVIAPGGDSSARAPKRGEFPRRECRLVPRALGDLTPGF